MWTVVEDNLCLINPFYVDTLTSGEEEAQHAVAALSVQVGKPIRSQLAERLPTAEVIIAKMGVVVAQYKYDGFHAQIHKDGGQVTIFSRNLENMSHMFPELITGTLKQVRAERAILDAVSLGLEGLVVKKLESRYEAGARNFNWVKLKRHSAGALNDTIDCVLLGYLFGRGKRAALGAGSLLVGVYDPLCRDMLISLLLVYTDERKVSLMRHDERSKSHVCPTREEARFERDFCPSECRSLECGPYPRIPY